MQNVASTEHSRVSNTKAHTERSCHTNESMMKKKKEYDGMESIVCVCLCVVHLPAIDVDVVVGVTARARAIITINEIGK